MEIVGAGKLDKSKKEDLHLLTGQGRNDLIDRKEIMDFSREFVLTPNVIEKDYALGWVLAGISESS